MKRGQTNVFGSPDLLGDSGGEQALATVHCPPHVELATPFMHPLAENWS
jgi:hypothetical protein